MILLILNLTGAVYAQDALSLPPCDEELVAVLRNLQNKTSEPALQESTLTHGTADQHAGDRTHVVPSKQTPVDYKINMHDLTIQVKTESRDINCIFEVNGSIYSPLLYAVSLESPDAVKLLLRQGADPNFVQPERNVTPLARVAWKSAKKDPASKLWKDHFRMAADLIAYGADEKYKFLVDIPQIINGVEDVIEIKTSIKMMNPKLIKDVEKFQRHDLMGRTPQAREQIKLQAERNRQKAARARMKKAQKVVF